MLLVEFTKYFKPMLRVTNKAIRNLPCHSATNSTIYTKKNGTAGVFLNRTSLEKQNPMAGIELKGNFQVK